MTKPNTPLRTQLSKPDLVEALRAAGAKLDGKEKNVICPFHDDHAPSAQINQGSTDGKWRFKCHGCGWKGDVVDVLAYNKGITVPEMLRELRKEEAPQERKPTRAQQPEPPHRPEPQQQPNEAPDPLAPDASKPIFATIEDAKKAHRPDWVLEDEYLYNDAGGKLIFPKWRLRLPNGKKAFLSAAPVHGGWQLKYIREPFPLYHLDRITKDKDAAFIVVVEGEKCADALDNVALATTIHNGAPSPKENRAEKTDWTPLAGKTVYLWPDNDEKGFRHMEQVQDILAQLFPRPKILWVQLPNDADKKYDVAELLNPIKDHAEKRMAVLKALKDAVPHGDSDLIAKRIEDIISGEYEEIQWPWVKISRLTKALQPEKVTFLCGHPGSNKSFFLMDCLAFWHKRGYRVSSFQLEDDKAFHLYRAFVQAVGESKLFENEWIKEHEFKVKTWFKEQADFLNSFGPCIHSGNTPTISLKQVQEWVVARCKAGDDIVTVDPISIASRENPWQDDLDFVSTCKDAAQKSGSRLIFVTHPSGKNPGAPTINDMAGGQAYQRLCHTLLFIESSGGEDMTNFCVRASASGEVEHEEVLHNRIIHMLKTRLGAGSGLKLAYNMGLSTMGFEERGLLAGKAIQKELKKCSSDSKTSTSGTHGGAVPRKTIPAASSAMFGGESERERQADIFNDIPGKGNN